MKVLLTGSNGYIGTNVKSKFQSKYNLTALTRGELDLTDTIAVSNWFRNQYFDVVIHTAIVGGKRLTAHIDDDSVNQANQLMYNNLLSNKQHFNRFISLGSGYEKYASETPYGFSKKKIAESILETENFYNVRIFGIFDEHEHPTRFVRANITRYIQKEPMILHSNKIMDFFYMQDLINLLEHYMIEREPRKEINCCYDQKFTFLNIANMINELSDYKVEINIENSNLEFYCDYNNFEFPIKLIGLEKGISITYNKLLGENHAH